MVINLWILKNLIPGKKYNHLNYNINSSSNKEPMIYKKKRSFSNRSDYTYIKDQTMDYVQSFGSSKSELSYFKDHGTIHRNTEFTSFYNTINKSNKSDHDLAQLAQSYPGNYNRNNYGLAQLSSLPSPSSYWQ